MLRMVLALGFPRLSRGLSDMWVRKAPVFLPGLFLCLVRVGRCGRGVRLVGLVWDGV